ncbi:MAG: RNA polymerase sigma factor RpoD/SigA [Gemmatimonadota bacterium]|nr:RNA polymerase sigma factor RpoD/SigA [Gemmatimonadota bacterium]
MPDKTISRGRRAERRPDLIDRSAGRDLLDLYIADAHEAPMRSAAEQKSLARVMRDPARSDDERAAARDALIAANLRFAFSIAKQYQHRGLELADLIAEANTGLVRAADKYDPDVGVNFISYAVWWVRQALHASITKQSRAVRLPLNRAADLTRVARAREALTGALGRDPTPDEIARVAELAPDIVKDLIRLMQPERSLDEPLDDRRHDGRTFGTVLAVEGDDAGTLPAGLEEESRRAALLRALTVLPPRDQRVIILYYGLDGEEARTLNEIATMFGVTRERVRQLRDRALSSLRRGDVAELLKREWAA